SIPANSQLTLEVGSSSACQGSWFSKPFTTTSSDISLGNIDIGSSYVATVTGTMTNCNGLPVTNGYVLVKNGYQYYRYDINTGSFTFNASICGNNNTVTIVGTDLTSMQEGTSNTYSLISGNNVIGNL